MHALTLIVYLINRQSNYVCRTHYFAFKKQTGEENVNKCDHDKRFVGKVCLP